MANKYEIVLILHLAMILLDLCFNTAVTIMFYDHTIQLMLFILQDTTIVMSIIVLVISFSSTFVFQAGLIAIIFKRFAVTLVISSFYLFISIALHFFSLRDRWKSDERYIWPAYITVLYAIQRTTAVMHYFTYKRTALLLSDPRYYHDTEWLREKVRTRI